MNITYDYYRIFYYVAKYGSFSRAAEMLLQGQPNVTKTINKLEAQLGCRLFVRSNKGVRLTSEGEKLYIHAEIAFENLNRAELEIVSEQRLDGGIVTIATTEIALYGALLPAIRKFSEDFPGVRIRIANQTTPQALETLKNDLADIAVVTLHGKPDDRFRIHKICDFRDILCCQKGYLDGNDKDIFELPYIAHNKHSLTYEFYREYFAQLGISKEADIEVATSDQILPIVKSGIGIGFVSEFLAEPALNSYEIEEIYLPTPPDKRSICLVEDKKRALSVAANMFKRYLNK